MVESFALNISLEISICEIPLIDNTFNFATFIINTASSWGNNSCFCGACGLCQIFYIDFCVYVQCLYVHVLVPFMLACKSHNIFWGMRNIVMPLKLHNRIFVSKNCTIGYRNRYLSMSSLTYIVQNFSKNEML